MKGNSFSNGPTKVKDVQDVIEFLNGNDCNCNWCLQGHGK